MKIKKIYVLIILTLILSVILPTYTYGENQTTQTNSINNDPATWTSIDVSDKTVDVVGEKIGNSYDYDLVSSPWYSDTTVVDPDTDTVVTAWVRWNADEDNNDQIYLAFYKFIDVDGDGNAESVKKTIKFVDEYVDLISLDSISIGEFDGTKYVLITWTYDEGGTYYYNIAGAIYSIDGEYQWKGNIRRTEYNDEWSRSCFVPSYSSYGGFLVTWFVDEGDYEKIYFKWIYYTGTDWVLTSAVEIADDTDMYYKRADQMLAIGGNSKALVVFRKWDSTESKPDLYAALVDTSNGVQEIKLYDYSGVEETVGVRGAYRDGDFVVPLLSGDYVKYQVISESDGSILATKSLTSNGEHPYIISLSDRFVIAYIDKNSDSNGNPAVANIDSGWYYHYKILDTTVDYAKHPIISYSSSSSFIYVWSGGSSTSNYDIRYAIIDLGDPTDVPYYTEKGTLISDSNNQIVHGFGALSSNEYIITYTDLSDGEEDLLAYVKAPDSESISTITLYKLPSEADDYKNKILTLIDNAGSKVYVAVAYFQEDSPGETGTISKALVDAKNRGVDVRVIMDDDANNGAIYNYLNKNGVPVINDTNLGDATHIMHNKFMVVDGSKIIVATVNFIPDDFDKNNNTAIYIESKSVAYFYEQEFLHMWNNGNGRFGIQKTNDYSFVLFISYTTDSTTRTIIFEGYFSPLSYGENGRIPSVIYGFLTRASSSIYFASYIFTTSGWVRPINETLGDKYKAGKDVKGVFDEMMNVDSKGRMLYFILDSGIPVAIDNHPYKMHAKLFTVDNETAILGSWNPTKSATENHDENILVIREDTDQGFAKDIAGYILSMYNSGNFVRSPYQYTPNHLVIDKVMFYPDTSGNPDLEWVEIYNPTDSAISLSNYVIGDAETMIGSTLPYDNEGMYKFPDGASIPAREYIVIAYDAEAFHNIYGLYPNYEIAGTVDSVPDLAPYNTIRYSGSWNLDDSGDEVILAVDQNGFLQVIDACWYGDSDYMETQDGFQPTSGNPLDITGISPGDGIVDKYLTGGSSYWDAIKMGYKYEIESSPAPVPETWIVGILIVLVISVYIFYRFRLKRS